MLSQDGYAPGQLSERGGRIERRADGALQQRPEPAGGRSSNSPPSATRRACSRWAATSWARSFASGEPVVGVPGEGNLGVLQSGARSKRATSISPPNSSTMMTAQRIYQANAQTIKHAGPGAADPCSTPISTEVVAAMDRMIYLSMSGAKAAMQRQDVLANNLANVSDQRLPRRARLLFARCRCRASGASARACTRPGGPPWARATSPGAVTPTGRPLDVAMKGNAWLTVQGPRRHRGLHPRRIARMSTHRGSSSPRPGCRCWARADRLRFRRAARPRSPVTAP